MPDLVFVVPEGADPISRQFRLLIQVLREDAASTERLQARARLCGRLAAALDMAPEALERLVDAALVPTSVAGTLLVQDIHHAVTFGYRSSALQRSSAPLAAA